MSPIMTFNWLNVMDDAGERLAPVDRQFFVKLSYAFQR